jgi:hypothetical protein
MVQAQKGAAKSLTMLSQPEDEGRKILRNKNT